MHISIIIQRLLHRGAETLIKLTFQENKKKTDVVSKAHAFSEACTWEAEAGGPEVLSQSGLYSRTHLVNKQINNLNEARIIQRHV